MITVSVIMPVYNAEKYLDKAIGSVCYQTYPDWELIIVNDCSTDSSQKICYDWSKKDSRIRVIDLTVNSGPAVARNKGLDAAIGKYVSFIDSDDTYKKDFLSKMVGTAESKEAELVWCNYDEIDSHGHCNIREHNLPCNQPINKMSLLELYFVPTIGLGNLWNKLYRRDIIESKSIRINENRTRAEDWEFNLFFFQEINICIAIEDALYDYIRQNSGSVMASYRRKDFELMCRSQELLLEMAEKYQLDIDERYLWGVFLYNSIAYLQLMYKNEPNRYSRLKEICHNDKFKLAVDKNYTDYLTSFQKCIYWSLKLKLAAVVHILMSR